MLDLVSFTLQLIQNRKICFLEIGEYCYFVALAVLPRVVPEAPLKLGLETYWHTVDTKMDNGTARLISA